MTKEQKINILEVRKANLLSRPKVNGNILKKIERKIRILRIEDNNGRNLYNGR